MFKQINSAVENVPSKAIFDHLRNYFMCAFLLAIGTFEFRAQTNSFFGLIQSQYSGAGVIGLSCVLIGLNFYSGIRSISKSKYHLIFTLGLVLIYIFFNDSSDRNGMEFQNNSLNMILKNSADNVGTK